MRFTPMTLLCIAGLSLAGAASAETFRYDARGRLIEATGTTTRTYTYDPADNVRAVSLGTPLAANASFAGAEPVAGRTVASADVARGAARGDTTLVARAGGSPPRTPRRDASNSGADAVGEP